jgi:hypothetical protein
MTALAHGLFLAHGIGAVRDLPVPAWLFLWGGAVVLVASFVALGALWREPLLARHAPGKAIPEWLERILRSVALRIVLGAISTALLLLVFLTALLGETNPNDNLAPTFIYVVFWLGLVPLQVFFGDVWRVLNPWRAVADATVWVLEHVLRRSLEPLGELPEWVGRWPAAALLFLFAAMELAYIDPASPRALALAVALYSYVTWFGMAAFGRETWLQQGEAFSAYFGLLARVAPFGLRESDDRIVVRWPFTGLAGYPRVPGTGAVVAVMLGSVGFDGFSRTSLWQNLIADAEAPYVLDDPRKAELVVTGLNLLGLIAAILFVAIAYIAATSAARRTVDAPHSLTRQFVFSLVPIALVYAVAHYFSLLIIQGQFILPLASDPFGTGANWLGSLGDYQPNLTPLAPNTIWYIQVGALVAGHVAGLAIAHDRAVTLFRSRDAALRSQYAMLALMILYTIGGMWLLSQN